MQIVPAGSIPEAVKLDLESNPIEFYKTGQEMVRLCDAMRGKGLSAVQVGIPWDFFVVKDIAWKSPKPVFFANCTYEKIGQETSSVEGCLSLPALEGGSRKFRVNRSSKIHLRGWWLDDREELVFRSIDRVVDLREDAIVLQHEIDHSRGILISQIGKEIFLW